MKRLVLDGVMLILFFLVMCFPYLPKLMHEVLGIALPIAVAVHLRWNRAWFASLRRSRWTPRKAFSCAVNVLLIAVTVTVIATGLAISNYLLKDVVPLAWQRNIWLHQLHVSLPYVWLILLGLHTGLHWPGLWGRLSHAITLPLPAAKRRVITGLAVSVTAVVGICGSFLHRVGDRILMKHIFHTPAMEHDFAVYALLLCCVFGLYATIGVAATKIFSAAEKRHKFGNP